MYKKTPTSKPGGVDTALQRFSDMIISRMEAMKDENWQKPWVSVSSQGRPQNISGREYNGGNAFFLMLQQMEEHHKLPVYMTFKQAHDLDCHVKKDMHAFPVIYWDFVVYDSKGNKVPKEEYNKMDQAERKDVKVLPFMRQYPVFNIDQTNFKEIHPDRYQQLEERFKPHVITDEKGMYSNPGIDAMLKDQSWVCPIKSVIGDSAFYSKANDFIQIPKKNQFNNPDPEKAFIGGMEYYSTLLHEMTHSTGHESRLNRLEAGRFGDPKYAKEELVAELTSSMVGNSLGFDAKVRDNSARYLNNWIGALREEPKFIVSLMSDVSKASEMIFQHINPELAITKEQGIGDSAKESQPAVPDGFKSPVVLKEPDGSFSLKASFNGVELPAKPISEGNADLFLHLRESPERNAFVGKLLSDTFKNEIKPEANNQDVSKGFKTAL